MRGKVYRARELEQCHRQLRSRWLHAKQKAPPSDGASLCQVCGGGYDLA